PPTLLSFFLTPRPPTPTLFPYTTLFRSCGQERLAHDAEHALARALGDRDEPAELEPRQLDPALGAHRGEPEVVEEVAGEDRLVHPEALGRALALRVSVCECLQRPRVPVARLPDRRQEQRLEHPRLRRVGQVRA